VARALQAYSSSCRLTNIGAKLIIDASERANEECGDGTTTATLLAGSLLEEGQKLLIGSSLNPVELRKGIKHSADKLCSILDTMSLKIQGPEDPLLRQVALISSNQDTHLADLIQEIHSRIGLEGTISIQEGQGHMKTVVQYVEGYALDGQGYLSPYFASQEKGKKLEYEGGVYVVVIDEIVSSIR